MTVVGLVVLLIVAFAVGSLGELFGRLQAPGGYLGSTVVGFIGAWVGGALFRFGPTVGGIRIVPAIISGAVFAFALRAILMGASRVTHRHRTTA